jgi:beclin 1
MPWSGYTEYQLDASLVDLAPSAYDMIVTSLPPTPPSHVQPPSEADKLARLPTPASVKSAWQKSKNASASKPAPSSSRLQPSSLLPNESFIILQDSFLNTSGTTVSPPLSSKKGSSSKSPGTPTKFATPTKESEPRNQNPSHISHHLRSTLRLFNLLSTRTDIDHPLCTECSQILLNSLRRQLDEIKKERDGYIAFEKEVRKEKDREGQGMSKEEAEKRIEKLKADERKAIEQLKEAEREREQLDEELKALESEEKTLEQEETEYESHP